MRIYFDTNVYNFIADYGEAKEVRRLLEASSHAVVASSLNIHEISRISSRASRRKELATLSVVASAYFDKPESWIHAREVRAEIERCRPEWRTVVPFRKKERAFLKAHRSQWTEVKARRLSGDVKRFASVCEAGVAQHKEFQKVFRQRLRRLDKLALWNTGESLERIGELATTDPETFWRIDCLQVWFNAIAMKNPASRDYDDWLSPYIIDGSFRDAAYAVFWLSDVDPDNVPYNRVTALASYYQMRHKIHPFQAITCVLSPFFVKAGGSVIIPVGLEV